MKLLLLGTASAEGWPAAYCDCPVCQLARKNGGHDLRMRSGALIDDDLKIDHSPDTIVHMQHARRSLAKVRSIIFTHEHADHLFATELKRTVDLAKNLPPQPPIAIYANHRVVDKIREAFDDPLKFRLDIQPPLEPFKPVKLSDAGGGTGEGTTILPLPATHCEDALVFRITRNNRSIFYGHDSGVYTTETLDALGKAGPLDLALFDCTHTSRTDVAFKHHLGLHTILPMIEELRRRGAIVPTTRLVATHFSPHSGAKSHEELLALLNPHNIEVAYDGMLIDV
jgi:phosphoribosyl 1,2-cyclic phosphate phosphodiesterase